MATQTGTFRTQRAGRYIEQLCKHFAHKVEVSYDEMRGEAALPAGPATMVAEPEMLRIAVTGKDAAALEMARYVIDSHLKTFAFREGFEAMDWAEPEGL
ncbi:DUF2218 domain-containing protein [Gymnodinialimonas sp.]